MSGNEFLIQQLLKEGWLKSPHLIEAFYQIKREDFVPAEEKEYAYLNEALPLMAGQTISQPLVVAFMLELLDPQYGEKILDIGSGSGWTSALLGYLVSHQSFKSKKEAQPGRVIGLEIIPELKIFGENNVKKYNFIKKGIVEIFCLDGKGGYPKEAPYDKILVGASGEEIPKTLVKQLKIGGRLVMPVKESIVKIEKKGDSTYQKEEYPGFVFVPLV
jgi:protein-L-isoaspartate(D-aspartate) O-methyltransferase